ncbi:MAG: hypothetical protein ABEJ89_02650 [Haloarculaceae archaeon]
MRRETVAIVLLVAVVLLPMWYVAMTSGTESGGPSLGTGADPVAVNTSARLDPTGKYLPSPTEVGVNEAGVLTWVALLGMVAVMVGAKRFVDRIGGVRDAIRPTDDGVVTVPPYLEAADRRIIEYVPATNDWGGLVIVGVLSWAAVSFAGLLVFEGFTRARTQFLGTYAGMLFVTLALLVMAYVAYFVPSVTVAESREHATTEDT